MWFLLALGILLAEAKVSSGEILELEDGSFYAGQVKDGRPDGNGTLTDKHGSNFTGIFVNGQKSGFFIVDFSNHSRYEGMYKDDMKNGKGIYAEPCQYDYKKNGRFGGCFFEWLDSSKFGKGLKALTSQVLEGVEIDFNGLFKHNPNYGWDAGPRNDTLDESLAVFYAGEFKNDLYNGHGVYISAHKPLKMYDVEWRNGLQNGKGLEIWRHLNVSEPYMIYRGEYKDGKHHGVGIQSWSNTKCFTEFQNFSPPESGAWKGPVIENCTEHDGDRRRYEGEFKDGDKYGTGVEIWPDNQKFVGEVRNGTQYGEMSWPDGRNYVGEFNQTAREGQGLMTWADGRTYQGEWRKDKRVGEGVMIWPDGQRFEGEWKTEDEDSFLKDQKKKLRSKLEVWTTEDVCICMDSKYVKYDTVNNKEYWSSGRLLGNGSMTWSDGSKYSGEWLKGECSTNPFKDEDEDECSDKEKDVGNKHGNGVMIWADGRKYDGDWYKDQMFGKGVMIWPDGLKYQGDWSRDKRHGEGTLAKTNGEIYDGLWKNDVRDGYGKITMKNGKQCIQYWMDGVDKSKPCA